MATIISAATNKTGFINRTANITIIAITPTIFPIICIPEKSPWLAADIARIIKIIMAVNNPIILSLFLKY